MSEYRPMAFMPYNKERITMWVCWKGESCLPGWPSIASIQRSVEEALARRRELV